MKQKNFERCFPGIRKLTLGTPDTLTPHSFFGGKESPRLSRMEDCSLPFSADQIHGTELKNGYLVTIPLAEKEDIYGMGLQFHSLLQNGSRKTLKTNADPPKDTGDSHAPVPFYVSSRGYGLLADTAKCVTFDFGASRKIAARAPVQEKQIAGSTRELYENEDSGNEISVFIPGAKGITLFFFADRSIRGAAERYNLFSGGGAMPPIWGLGALYRCYTRFDQKQAEAMIQNFAEHDIPVSMLGLEPGWHSHAYSCSFEWSPKRYPEPDRLIRLAKENGMELNLWEQSYVHPTAKFYEEILPFSGDYEVWEGAVPDFACPEAGEIYGRRQGELIDQGIAAVKLDECDGSDYTGDWYYPAFSQFPSGLTGEEEKNLYGALVQRVIEKAFARRNLRTFSEVRANWSYAAPMGFVLYSDLYDHDEFIRGVSSASFSGLLWSPEVRQCQTGDELIRRMQSAAFSPMMVINAWMVPSPPWDQFDIQKNLAGELLPDDTLRQKCRELIRLRNAFVPYLYTAYADYAEFGTPPFRAMVMDFPEDARFRKADDCWMMGESIYAAPISAGNTSRRIRLPEGVWYDFWTEERLTGGREIETDSENIPLYVKEGTLLPLSDGSRILSDSEISLELRVYGGSGKAVLIEDDRKSLNYRQGQQIRHLLEVRNGKLLSDLPAGYRLAGIRTVL